MPAPSEIRASHYAHTFRDSLGNPEFTRDDIDQYLITCAIPFWRNMIDLTQREDSRSDFKKDLALYGDKNPEYSRTTVAAFMTLDSIDLITEEQRDMCFEEKDTQGFVFWIDFGAGAHYMANRLASISHAQDDPAIDLTKLALKSTMHFDPFMDAKSKKEVERSARKDFTYGANLLKRDPTGKLLLRRTLDTLDQAPNDFSMGIPEFFRNGAAYVENFYMEIYKLTPERKKPSKKR